jgi:hypothetical protein
MNDNTKATGVSKLINALVESLVSAFASVVVALIKFYYSIFPAPSAYSERDKQEHAEFFSLTRIVVKDVTVASRDIIDHNAKTIDNFKRALSAKALVNNTEEKLKASYFRTPENLKKAHHLMLNYLKLTRDYCDLLARALMQHAMSPGVPENLEIIKHTHAKSMEALHDICDELENFARTMNQKASDLEEWADDTEKLAKETLKQDVKKAMGRQDN